MREREIRFFCIKVPSERRLISQKIAIGGLYVGKFLAMSMYRMKQSGRFYIALFVKIANWQSYFINNYCNSSKINYLFTHQQLINMRHQEEDESNQQD